MEPRARASADQFSILLEYMERHGDLARPLPGARGRLRADFMWEDLANTLNSVDGGVKKTTDRWKKVWADWKSKTKKKSITKRQRTTNGTDGGPSTIVSRTLTATEARVIGIIGANAVDGLAGLEEQDFNIPVTATYPETIYSDSEFGSENIAIDQYEMAPPLPTSSPRVASPLPPVPTTPPQSNSRTAASPHSDVATPLRRSLRARRRRTLTPFDRPTSEFAAIEQRRLQLEERRLQLDERREQTEARRVEVDNERNHLLGRFADIAEALLQQYLSRARDSVSTA